MARVAELDEHSDRRRKRSSISPPIQTDPKWDEGAVYQSLLRTAGIHPVSDHISSIGAPLKAPPELLIIDRALSPLLPKVRGGMISRLLNTINELAIAEDRIRQASIKSQKLWRALDPSVSPISQLPDELLLMIFDHGVQDELTQLLTYNSESSDFPVVGDATLETNIRPHFPFPLLVSHICENWRSLALDRSSLWTHINPYWNIHQVTMWLQRSKNKPLHLDLIDAVSRVGEIQYSLIREHASRWLSAVVHIGNVVMEGGEDGVANCLSDFLFTTNGDKPTRLPRLRHLSISSSASVRLPLYASGLDLFPSLETLRLSNAAVGSIDELFSRVIRAQADLSGLFTWNWSGIGSATSLKSLTLHSPPGAQDEENGLEDGWTTWSLPTLTHLCIDSMPSGVCRSFLTMLRAPALQSFHMFLKGKDRRARQAMLDFALIHPSITSVQLYGYPNYALEILCPPLSDDDAQPEQPFPALRSLTLAKMSYLSFELDDIKNLRRFFTTREKLLTKQAISSPVTHKAASPCTRYTRLHTLRLDASILAELHCIASVDAGPGSETFVDEMEDEDGDYDSEMDADALTDADAMTDADVDEDAPQVTEDGGQAAVADDEDELADGEEEVEVELASVGVGSSDGDDDFGSDEEDEESEEEDAHDELLSSQSEPDAHAEEDITLELTELGKGEDGDVDELSSNAEEERVGGEEWLRRHVEVLEIIQYDWRTENP